MRNSKSVLAVALLVLVGFSVQAGQTKTHKAASRRAAPPAQTDTAALERRVEDALDLAADYRADGISPQEIQEVKGLLDLDFPHTERGAELKARVYVELARIYDAQGISPMAIKLLQDATVDLGDFPTAEITVREELVDVYRGLGFAPQAIQEHKRIRNLRARLDS